MDRKAIFLEQHKATYNENHWFVSLKFALKGLTEEQASWKSNDSTNSIWEIVNHFIFWNERYLNRFKNQSVSESEVSNHSTFTNQEELDWQRTVDKINEIFEEWEALIKDTDDEKLDSEAYENSSSTWWSVLSNMTIHHAYHIGQIIHIRKQQGSWDEKNGVH